MPWLNIGSSCSLVVMDLPLRVYIGAIKAGSGLNWEHRGWSYTLNIDHVCFRGMIYWGKYSRMNHYEQLSLETAHLLLWLRHQEGSMTYEIFLVASVALRGLWSQYIVYTPYLATHPTLLQTRGNISNGQRSNFCNFRVWSSPSFFILSLLMFTLVNIPDIALVPLVVPKVSFQWKSWETEPNSGWKK